MFFSINGSFVRNLYIINFILNKQKHKKVAIDDNNNNNKKKRKEKYWNLNKYVSRCFIQIRIKLNELSNVCLLMCF